MWEGSNCSERFKSLKQESKIKATVQCDTATRRRRRVYRTGRAERQPAKSRPGRWRKCSVARLSQQRHSAALTLHTAVCFVHTACVREEHRRYRAHVKVIEQHWGSPFSPTFMVSNSGCQDWSQACLPTELSHWSLSCFNIIEGNVLHHKLLPVHRAIHSSLVTLQKLTASLSKQPNTAGRCTFLVCSQPSSF